MVNVTTAQYVISAIEYLLFFHRPEHQLELLYLCEQF
jgi:hypothetical protein